MRECLGCHLDGCYFCLEYRSKRGKTSSSFSYDSTIDNWSTIVRRATGPCKPSKGSTYINICTCLSVCLSVCLCFDLASSCCPGVYECRCRYVSEREEARRRTAIGCCVCGLRRLWFLMMFNSSTTHNAYLYLLARRSLWIHVRSFLWQKSPDPTF